MTSSVSDYSAYVAWRRSTDFWPHFASKEVRWDALVFLAGREILNESAARVTQADKRVSDSRVEDAVPDASVGDVASKVGGLGNKRVGVILPVEVVTAEPCTAAAKINKRVKLELPAEATDVVLPISLPTPRMAPKKYRSDICEIWKRFSVELREMIRKDVQDRPKQISLLHSRVAHLKNSEFLEALPEKDREYSRQMNVLKQIRNAIIAGVINQIN